MDLQDSAYKFQAEMQVQKEVDANRQEWEARQKTLELQQQAQLEAQRQQHETEREQMRLMFEKWKVEFMAGVDLKKHQDGMQEREIGAQREQFNRNEDRATAQEGNE